MKREHSIVMDSFCKANDLYDTNDHFDVYILKICVFIH